MSDSDFNPTAGLWDGARTKSRRTAIESVTTAKEGGASASAEQDDDEAEREALANGLLGASMPSLAATAATTTAELQSSFSSLLSSSASEGPGSRSSSRQRRGRRSTHPSHPHHQPSLVEAARALEVPPLPAELFDDAVEISRRPPGGRPPARGAHDGDEGEDCDVAGLLSRLSAAGAPPPPDRLEAPPLPAAGWYGGGLDADVLLSAGADYRTAAPRKAEEDDYEFEALLSILAAAETPPAAPAPIEALHRADSAAYDLVLVPLPPSAAAASSPPAAPARPWPPTPPPGWGAGGDGPGVVCQCCYEEIPPSSTMQVFACSASAPDDDGPDDDPRKMPASPGGKPPPPRQERRRRRQQEEPHSVCAHCLSAYAKEWVFGGTCYPLRRRRRESGGGGTGGGDFFSLELPCLSPGCEAGTYPRSAVERALASPKVLRHYDEKMARATRLETAAGEKEAAEAAAAAEGGREEAGPTAAAARRRTGSALSSSSSSHHRRTAEEALTERTVRRCPVCRAPVIKEGRTCHKIRCANCDFRFCYLCRAELPQAGYDHFCRHRYDAPCGECRKEGISCHLWSREDEPEPRGEEEASAGGGGGDAAGGDAAGRDAAGGGAGGAAPSRERHPRRHAPRPRAARRSASDGAAARRAGSQRGSDDSGDKEPRGEQGQVFWKKLRPRRKGNS